MRVALEHLEKFRHEAALPVTITQARWSSKGWVVGYRVGHDLDRLLLVGAYDATVRELEAA